MEHLITLFESESAHAGTSIPEAARLLAARLAHVERLRATGV